MQVARDAVGVELDVEHPLRNDPPLAGAGDAAVLQRVLDGEEHAGRGARVAVVDENRAAPQQVTVTLECHVDDGVEQRMAGADEGGERLAGRRDQRLLEGDAFVARQHRLADPDHPVAAAHEGRDVRHLVAARLALPRRPAEPPERLAEERLDVVWLEAARLRPLHLFADALHARGVHRVVDELPLFQEVLQRARVEGVVHGGVEPRPHFGPLPVPDRVEQQLPQGPPLELQLPEHVEHLAAEGLPGPLQLLEQPPVDVALARIVGDQVPQVADLGLADPVDAPEALLQPVRVPRQVVVHHQVGPLQVDALAGCISSQQHLNVGVMAERLLHRQPLLAADTAMDHDDRLLAAQQSRDALLQVP